MDAIRRRAHSRARDQNHVFFSLELAPAADAAAWISVRARFPPILARIDSAE